MKITVAYAAAQQPVWLATLDVPENSTVQDALTQSGVLTQFPEIDLEKQKVGIFGKVVKLNTALNDGDRVEIYRPIVADTKKAAKRKDDDDDDDE